VKGREQKLESLCYIFVADSMSLRAANGVVVRVSDLGSKGLRFDPWVVPNVNACKYLLLSCLMSCKG